MAAVIRHPSATLEATEPGSARLPQGRVEATGGASLLTTEDLTRRLGLSRAALDLRRLAGKLLALDPGTGGDFVYPDWQCELLAKPARRQAFERVLQILNPVTPWSQYQFFSQPCPALAQRVPWLVLCSGDPSVVLVAASTWVRERHANT